MKSLILTGCVLLSLSVYSQRNRAPKMAPLYADGYYVNQRNDTIRGKVQTNPSNKIAFYSQFSFLKPPTKRAKLLNAKRTKAYGFDNRHFVTVEYRGEKLFLERLVSGRLQFFEYRFDGKIYGYEAVESSYFIKDTYAEGEDSDLQELKKLSNMFYKKSLKPYMKDQKDIWDNLDKFNFDEETVMKSIIEFNKNYIKSAN